MAKRRTATRRIGWRKTRKFNGTPIEKQREPHASGRRLRVSYNLAPHARAMVTELVDQGLYLNHSAVVEQAVEVLYGTLQRQSRVKRPPATTL